jgi:hypothetical protein
MACEFIQQVIEGKFIAPAGRFGLIRLHHLNLVIETAEQLFMQFV